jgi:biotin carboxyl carrier protein
MFCSVCGVKSFYVPRSHPDGYSVNFRCLDAEEFHSVLTTISTAGIGSSMSDELAAARRRQPEMATQILMPALSPTMEEGKLAKWLVKEGDEVRSGDILAEIETDKATMEFEAVDEGKIGKILVPEGTEGVKVNQPIAELLGEGEKPGNGAAIFRPRCNRSRMPCLRNPDRRRRPLTPTLSPSGGRGIEACHSPRPLRGRGQARCVSVARG